MNKLRKNRRNRNYQHPIAGFAWGASIVIVIGTLTIWLIVQWHLIISYLISINIVTLILWGWDKTISSTKITRVPERILHALAFTGGSPAALIGQHLFRHKTAKQSFQVKYWLIVIVQTGLAYYFFVITS